MPNCYVLKDSFQNNTIHAIREETREESFIRVIQSINKNTNEKEEKATNQPCT